MIFDVNDLDETLPAPWEWDVKRLTASVVLAGRHIQLKQSETARAARAAVHSYREHMAEYAFMKALDIWYDRIDLKRLIDAAPDEEERARMEKVLEKARGRSVAEHDFPKLAEQVGSTPRIKDNPPLIFHHPLVKEQEGTEELKAAWALYHDSLPEHVRVLFDRFHLCDMAVKVVGVGSVGTICLVALFMAADDDPLFLQIKEAKASVLEPYAGKSLAREPRSARRRRPASDAGGERQLPRVDAGKARARLLRASAPRREDHCGHRQHGRRTTSAIRGRVRVGAGPRARALGRRCHDRGLHGIGPQL